MFLWMEHGGIYAVANLRAELSLAKTGIAPACSKKAKCLRRLIAAGEYLIAQKYTDRDHLAIEAVPMAAC